MKRELSFFRPIISNLLFCLAVIAFLASCSEKNDGDKQMANTVVKDSITKSNITFIKDCKVFESRARKLDSTLMQELEINKQTASQAIKAFTEFADYCHHDSLAPIYYLKTAQVARA